MIGPPFWSNTCTRRHRLKFVLFELIKPQLVNAQRLMHLLTRLLASIIPSQVSSKEKARPSTPEEEPDAVASIIGNYGRWQLLITFLLSLFSFPCTFHIYLPTFTARATNFWCRMPENFSSLPLTEWINYSQPVDACSVRVIPPGVTVESILNHTAPVINSFVECTAWDYDRSEVGDTIISEWNLVCDRASLTSLAEVVFLIGVGVGGVVGGWISDKRGAVKILRAATPSAAKSHDAARNSLSFLEFIKAYDSVPVHKKQRAMERRTVTLSED
ncbi:hypothetical protein evm_008837 [Chilo suppressalis]|nr:hypothetical protein evm_008837 [Chilo suppressalis]